VHAPSEEKSDDSKDSLHEELKQTNVDSLHNVRRKASRHFRNTKMEYLKAKIDELETNGKIKKYKRLIWGHQ